MVKTSAKKTKVLTNFLSKSGRLKLSKRVNKLEKDVLRNTDRFVIKRWQKIREVRSQIVIWCSLVSTILIAVGLQIFFSQSAYRDVTMVPGGTYREALVGKINSLNPLYASNEAEKSAAYLIFSRLFSYDTSGDLKNDLAKSITLSDDGLTYTVALRDDVRWHDGKKLSARDVKFTIDLMRNPSIKANLGNAWRGIKVEQVGDYSIEFTLPAVYAPFPSALTFAILPEHILSKVEVANLREAEFATEPIGSGILQYQVLRSASTGHSSKQILHLTPNKDYYQARAQINRFELHVFSQQDDLLKAVENNEINAASDVSLADIKVHCQWQFQESALQNAIFAFFNNDRQILKNVLVRRALRASLNLRQIRNDFNLEKGNWQILDYPILPNQLGQPKFEPKNWFDPVAAQRALQQAGFSLKNKFWHDRDNQILSLNMVTVKDASYSQLARQLTEAWRNFGIDVKLTVVDLNDPELDFGRNFLQPRNYDVLVYEITLGIDPDQFAYWHSSQKFANGLNQANYSNLLVDALLTTSRSSNDIILRRAKYQRFIEYWLKDVPAIALMRSNYGYAVNSHTKTYNPNGTMLAPQARYSQLSDFLVNRRLVYTTP